MALLYIKRYTRAFIQAHPDWLFVFGDNFERKGLGGQAKEARGEPNAVGIPTKRKPSMVESAFLDDGDLREWRATAGPDLKRIADHFDADGVVIWPLDDIGSGRAELQTRAPRIASIIRQFKMSME